MPRLLPAAIAAALAIALPLGCKKAGESWDFAGPKVVASFAPISSLAQSVGGPDAKVRTLMTSQGPHGFDATKQDAAMVRGADLLFINGLGLDTRPATQFKLAAGGSGIKMIDLGSKIPKADLLEPEHDHDHGDDNDHGHHHDGDADPHAWLGIKPAESYITTIRDELKTLDPAHAADYDERAAATVADLAAIQAEGAELLAGKKERRIVTFHESLTYFAKSFGLEIAAVIQHTPGAEPRGDELKKLVEICLKKNVRVIAVEPQFGAQSSAGRLCDELAARGVEGVQLVEIDPMETADPAELKAGWYQAKMRANLAALAGALK